MLSSAAVSDSAVLPWTVLCAHAQSWILYVSCHLHVAEDSAIFNCAYFNQGSQRRGLLALDGPPFLSRLLIGDCGVRYLLAESTCTGQQPAQHCKSGSTSPWHQDGVACLQKPKRLQ